MKEAGLSAIRIGEFAWSSLEPHEGKFTTDWLTEFVGKAGKMGINIFMCTPSACPPQWLTRRYPETLLIKGDGRPFNTYTRKHYCPSNPMFRELVRRVNVVLAEALALHNNILAWQIDNELGPHEVYRCFCPNCRREFHRWLRRKYGSLEELKVTVESVAKEMGGSVVTYRVPWGKHSGEARPMLANSQIDARWPAAVLSTDPGSVPCYFWRVGDGNYEPPVSWSKESSHDYWLTASAGEGGPLPTVAGGISTARASSQRISMRRRLPAKASSNPGAGRCAIPKATPGWCWMRGCAWRTHVG